MPLELRRAKNLDLIGPSCPRQRICRSGLIPHESPGLGRNAARLMAMTEHRRWPHVLFVAYLGLALLALAWPGPDWIAGRVRPFVLGLPFAFAWNVLWVVTTFVALGLYHHATGAQD